MKNHVSDNDVVNTPLNQCLHVWLFIEWMIDETVFVALGVFSV